MKMKEISQKLGIAAIALFATSIASADVINFKAMAEPGGLYGESIWSPLTINGTGFQLNITGTQSGSAAYAYLDANNAGLGVCGAPKAGATVNAATNSGANVCIDSGDDNVTVGEVLIFTPTVDVMINNIWFNNNHDGDKSLLNNIINIGGSAFTFTSGPAIGPADFAVGQSYLVQAGTSFLISFYEPEGSAGGDQFYVSKMDVSAVPEPSALALLGLGLLGLGLRRKKFSP